MIIIFRLRNFEHNCYYPDLLTNTVSNCLVPTEFLAMMTRVTKEEDTDEELRRAFQVFDRDGSGTISTEELRDVLRSVGENLTDSELDEMMRQVDVDQSGTIDCESLLLPFF